MPFHYRQHTYTSSETSSSVNADALPSVLARLQCISNVILVELSKIGLSLPTSAKKRLSKRFNGYLAELEDLDTALGAIENEMRSLDRALLAINHRHLNPDEQLQEIQEIAAQLCTLPLLSNKPASLLDGLNKIRGKLLPFERTHPHFLNEFSQLHDCVKTTLGTYDRLTEELKNIVAGNFRRKCTAAAGAYVKTAKAELNIERKVVKRCRAVNKAGRVLMKAVRSGSKDNVPMLERIVEAPISTKHAKDLAWKREYLLYVSGVRLVSMIPAFAMTVIIEKLGGAKAEGITPLLLKLNRKYNKSLRVFAVGLACGSAQKTRKTFEDVTDNAEEWLRQKKVPENRATPPKKTKPPGQWSTRGHGGLDTPPHTPTDTPFYEKPAASAGPPEEPVKNAPPTPKPENLLKKPKNKAAKKKRKKGDKW